MEHYDRRMVYAPEWMRKFACLAGDCPDVCCQQWNVDVDPAHAESLHHIEDPEMQKLIFRVEVPVEDVSEVKNKTAVKTERKVYPGYVMVYMIETTRSWYVVRNTRGVTGFVGPEGKPIALTDEEAYTMLHTKEASASMDFSIGERVRVIDLNDQEATIVDIEPSINKVKVRLDFLNGAEMTLSKEQIRRL